MSELEADLVQIARIGKAHGLRGEVTVELFTSDPQGRLAPGATLVTEATPGSGVPKTLTVASARDHNGTWLIGFDGSEPARPWHRCEPGVRAAQPPAEPTGGATGTVDPLKLSTGNSVVGVVAWSMSAPP